MRHHEHRKLLSLLSTCILACGPKLSTDLDGLDGRMFLSERVVEDGTPRRLVAGTRLWVRFHAAMDDTGNTGDTLDTDDMPDT